MDGGQLLTKHTASLNSSPSEFLLGHADKVDEADCLLVKVDKMDDVRNNQGFRPLHVQYGKKIKLIN